MGRLIPAGTGLSAYKKFKIIVDETSTEAPAMLPGMGAAPTTTTNQYS